MCKYWRDRWNHAADALIEVTTTAATPKEILHGPLISEFKTWDQQISACTAGQKCEMPGGGSTPVQYYLSKPLSYWDAPETIQWTLGLPLGKIPDLLALSPPLKKIERKVSAVCGERCSPEYRALVSMASMTIMNARSYNGSKKCDHPKSLMRPWLVRSHFGDIAHAVPSAELPRLPEDVLEVVGYTHGVSPDAPVFTHRFFDYLLFPEFAVFGGVVRDDRSSRLGRDAQNHTDSSAMREMPTDRSGLLEVAGELLRNKAKASSQVHQRSCGVYGKNDETYAFTARQWLDGIVQGKDIMSDHDSPVTSQSLSGLVWKSMGSWRMQDDGKVFIECRGKRGSRPCLDFKDGTGKWDASQYIRHVAHIARSLEGESSSIS